MKKFPLLTTVLLSSPFLLASKGYAADGLKLILAICVILFIIAGIFKGFDFLKKNGKMISVRLFRFGKQIFAFIRRFINRIHNRDVLNVVMHRAG